MEELRCFVCHKSGHLVKDCLFMASKMDKRSYNFTDKNVSSSACVTATDSFTWPAFITPVRRSGVRLAR